MKRSTHGLIMTTLLATGVAFGSTIAMAQQAEETVLLPDPVDTTGEYGLKVDINQDWAVVTSHDYLYIYHYNNGDWLLYDLQPLPYLTDTPNSLSEISLDGNQLALGMEFFDDQTQQDVGAVALYEFNGKVWSLSHILSPSDLTAYSRFGDYIDLDSDNGLLAVSCENCNSDSGSSNSERIVFVYRKAGDQWLEEQRIQAPGPSDYSFAHTIDIEGDTLAVGYPEDISDAPNYRGSVVVYRANIATRQQGLIWTIDQMIKAPTTWTIDPGENADDIDLFGSDVSLENGVLAVGAPRDQSLIGSFGPAGSVYTYTLNSDNTWVFDGTVLPPDFVQGSITEFGASVDLYGNELAIAAPYADAGTGAVYKVEVSSGSQQGSVAKYSPTFGGAAAQYGYGPGGVGVDNGRLILVSNENHSVILNTLVSKPFTSLK